MIKDRMPIDELRRRVSYDPETGVFIHARNTPGGGPAKKGATAGSRRPDGYIRLGHYPYRKIYAHQAAWALVHGYWPKEIDHIDGDPSNNRISNLREVDHQTNQRNMKQATTNTSGCTGVVWWPRDENWNAQIQVSGKRINLGYFDSFDDAVAARKAAEIKYDFHENHGNVCSR